MTSITEHITQAIVDRIAWCYGDVPIFTDEQKEGHETPSFFVREIVNRTERLLGNRRQKSLTFNIEYFAEDRPRRNIPANADLQRAEEVLSNALETITDREGNTYYGRDITGTIADGVLQVQVSYDYFILLIQDKEPLMERLFQIQSTKEDSSHGE